MSLENFKAFVREKPSLINYVRNKEVTWQEFYDMYELYGPNHSVWNKYLGITNNSPLSFKDLFNSLGNIDMNELQKGIGSLQKGIGYLQEMVKDKGSDIPSVRKSSYEPRPLYKHFDD